ncbi:MAG: hypothetical protein ACK4IA_11680 [Paracoccus hibiscisoli]|uniref:hypothetical protein n=1 Tax=Paracoccus hibiscisoli TaxID=2023261 RepID=UPI003918B0F5
MSHRENAIIYCVFLVSFVAGIFFAHIFSPKMIGMSEAYAVLMAAFIVPAAGVIAYWLQKRIDRQQAQLDRYYQVNVDAMEALGKLAAAKMGYSSDQEAQAHFVQAKLKLSVVGSDSVVRAYGKVSDVFSQQATGDANQEITKAMRAIRMEHLAKTNLTDDELLASSPFVRPRSNNGIVDTAPSKPT